LKYDPNHHIDPEAWMGSDEGERMEAIREYHRRHRIRLPNDRLHAAMHGIVENQVALGDTYPVKSVLLRLMREGLDRHEAVHAIGSVLAKEMFNALKNKSTETNVNVEYLKELERLTAKSWREGSC
jgi:hypothetical protein